MYEMANRSEANSRHAAVIEMFPGGTHEVLQLWLRDPAFQEMCDNLGDAQASLNRLVILSGPRERPEVAEYRSIIAELQKEIRAYVETKRS